MNQGVKTTLIVIFSIAGIIVLTEIMLRVYTFNTEKKQKMIFKDGAYQ